MNTFLLSLLYALIIGVSCSSNNLSDEECTRLGFRREELTRKRCMELGKFGLNTIKEDCLRCVKTDAKSSLRKKYAKARLEVCGCNLASYPQIQAFIKSDRPKQYENLTVKWVRGTLPTMKLLDENGNLAEELSLTKWDTDTVTEFLDEHLK
ncbi:selenoprotein F-like [Panonychus citri]|uniref:selenoprotein F-like n=1 Tax=Panonychus citri TaxID=50023 RepID=UPI002307D7FB|nr:selenoprotein F-like [Panonychus citri]